MIRETGGVATGAYIDGRSREFYVMWLVLLGMTLETLFKNDRINKMTFSDRKQEHGNDKWNLND